MYRYLGARRDLANYSRELVKVVQRSWSLLGVRGRQNLRCLEERLRKWQMLLQYKWLMLQLWGKLHMRLLLLLLLLLLPMDMLWPSKL